MSESCKISDDNKVACAYPRHSVIFSSKMAFPSLLDSLLSFYTGVVFVTSNKYMLFTVIVVLEPRCN